MNAPLDSILAGHWRTGRKVQRTIYLQLGPEPSVRDPLIGVVTALAAEAASFSSREGLTRAQPGPGGDVDRRS